jgi:hypothetical protein
MPSTAPPPLLGGARTGAARDSAHHPEGCRTPSGVRGARVPVEGRGRVHQARDVLRATLAPCAPRGGPRGSRCLRLPPNLAAWSIAAGVQLFYLSRIIGTSVTQIDATYRHLVPDSEDYLRGLLDSYDHNAAEAADGGAR